MPGPCLSPRGPRGHLEGRLPRILNRQTLKGKILFVHGTQRPHKPPCRGRGILYFIPNPKHVVRLFLTISSSSGRQRKLTGLLSINNPSGPGNRGQLVLCGLPGVPEPSESALVTQTPSPACKAASGPVSTADFNRCRLSRMSFHEGQAFPKNPSPSVEKGTCVELCSNPCFYSTSMETGKHGSGEDGRQVRCGRTAVIRRQHHATCRRCYVFTGDTCVHTWAASVYMTRVTTAELDVPRPVELSQQDRVEQRLPAQKLLTSL